MSQWDFKPKETYEALGQSVAKTVTTTGAKAIVTFSESGRTSRMVARYRPIVPIFVLTPNKATFAQSLISFGCEPVLIHKVKHLVDAQKIARTVLSEYNAAAKNDVFVLGAGIPFGSSGATNMMLVERV